MTRHSVALALWMSVPSVLVACRGDTTRPRGVAPTPKATPWAIPYPPKSAQSGPDSSARERQSADSAKSAMPSIRLVWPDSAARKPAAPR